MKRILGLILVLSMLAFSGCEYSLLIVAIEIEKYPDKIAYIVGHDSELDLTGCIVNRISRQGSKDSHDLMAEYSWFEINYDIDFNTPGVYVVDIILPVSPILFCSFAIEVVDISKY